VEVAEVARGSGSRDRGGKEFTPAADWCECCCASGERRPDGWLAGRLSDSLVTGLRASRLVALSVAEEGARNCRLAPASRVSGRANTPSWVYGDGSRDDSGIPPAAARPLHSQLHGVQEPTPRADEKQLCCRPGTAVKLLWPAVNSAWRPNLAIGPI
jgi:hypothetical protein